MLPTSVRTAENRGMNDLFGAKDRSHVMIDRAAWLDTVNRVLARLKTMPGGLLPILHAIQEEIGYIPPSPSPSLPTR